MNKLVYVIVPYFNEGGVTVSVINELLASSYNVILIDDCSSIPFDRNLIKKPADSKFVVIRHPINLGQGASLQTGIEFAMRMGADLYITFDSDGQHRVADIKNFIDAYNASNVEVVLGSRFKGSAINITIIKYFFLKLAVFFTRLTTGMKITDTHNGFRLLSKSFVSKFSFQQNRMAHASEILNYISSKNISFVEVPVSITYTEYSVKKGQRMSNFLNILSDLTLG